jgi:hypothetical protein
MSVLLSWEHPEQLNAKAIIDVTVTRLVSGSNKRVASGLDVVWGFFEDVENDDPSVDYQVEYRCLDGATTQLTTTALHRTKKTDDLCIISLQFKDLMGFPVQAKKLSLRNPVDTTFRRDIFTNMAGKLAFSLRRNARVSLQLEGDAHVLNTVVPDTPEADWAALSARGSLVDADQRGWY